jgi:hypothetical protein
MKNLLLLVSFLIIPVLSYSQEPDIYDQPEPEPEQKPVIIPKTFLGPSVGINNISGVIGFLAEVNIVKNVSLTGGVGIGAWGYKASLGGRYYRNYPKGVFYGLGISTATGGKDQEIELTVEPNNEKQTVTMDLDQVYNVNLSIGYQFRIGKKARFNFEVGYSAALQNEPYEVTTPGVQLTKESRQVMDFMSPSGLIFGLAFTFGI